MKLDKTKISIIFVLCLFAFSALLYSPEASMTTDAIFDDPAKDRINEEGEDTDSGSNLIIRVKHKDSGPLSANFSRVSELLDIENLSLNEIENQYTLNSNEVTIERLETPYSAWEAAFNSRNKSIRNSSNWGEVLQPINDDGWCGDDANLAENNALQATLLMLPQGSNAGVACPLFAGSSATQPPQSNELLWLVWLESSKTPVDWSELNDWCDKLTDNSDYNFEPAGVNMLFKEAELVAKQDLSKILPITVLVLALTLLLFFRDFNITVITLSSVVLVVLAVIGIFTLFDYQFSVIDGIAIPIIMGVAVDGAFWYKSSTKSREEVREILMLAMATTVAAVSLALISPIKAQRGLALVMIVGIIIDWVLTRFVLEDIYLKSRVVKPQSIDTGKKPAKLSWLWPSLLMILMLVAVTSPPGVEALDINQFLPEDSESLDELSELREIYVIASSTLVFLTIDLDSEDDSQIRDLLRFKSQFEQHPNIISYDTGLVEQNLVLGIGDVSLDANFEMVYENTSPSIVLQDPWLRVDDEITGCIMIAVIDGEDSTSAYQFSQDTKELLDDNNLSGEIGGDLITGISLAKSFEQTRILQILFAGIIVFTISYFMTSSVERSIRIAIGTIAVGIAVDGLASHIGGRGVNTAPAVLLGMGFAADYLSHASDNLRVNKYDNYARWGAAITSGLVFVAVSFSRFPPAKNTGILLSVTIFISVLLATSLAYTHKPDLYNGQQE